MKHYQTEFPNQRTHNPQAGSQLAQSFSPNKNKPNTRKSDMPIQQKMFDANSVWVITSETEGFVSENSLKNKQLAFSSRYRLNF